MAEQLPRAGLRPSALPVDTYARPFQQAIAPPPETNPLLELADSLKSVEPQLNRFLIGKQEEFIKEEVQKARADRLRVQKSFAEAIKAGEIEAGQSPFYVKEFKRLDGELTARNEYMFLLSDTINRSGLEAAAFETETEAAQAYSRLIESTRAEFLGQGGNFQDLDFLEGFEGARGGIENTLGNRFLQNRIEANEERFNDAVGAEIASILDSNAPAEEQTALIAAFGKRQIGQFGMSGSDFNRVTVDAINTRAMNLAAIGAYEEADALVDMVDRIEAGPGRSLGGTKYAREQKAATALRLVQLQRSEEQFMNARQDRIDRETREQRSADAMTAIMADPAADHSQLFEDLVWDSNTAQILPSIQAFQRAMIDDKFRAIEDPLTITSLRVDLLNGRKGPKAILELVEGNGASKETAASLLDDYQQFQTMTRQNGALPPLFRNLIEKEARSARFIIIGDELAATEEKRIKGEMAEARIRILLNKLLQKQPELLDDEIAFQLQALKIKESVMRTSDFRLEEDVFFDASAATSNIEFEVPPPEAIDALLKYPQKAAEFDEKYGKGSAAQFLPADEGQ